LILASLTARRLLTNQFVLGLHEKFYVNIYIQLDYVRSPYPQQSSTVEIWIIVLLLLSPSVSSSHSSCRTCCKFASGSSKGKLQDDLGEWKGQVGLAL
jgi:hypothetical protein